MFRQQTGQLFPQSDSVLVVVQRKIISVFLTPIVRSYSVGLVASNLTFRCAMAINYLCAFMSKRAFGKKTWLLGCVRKVDPFWSSAVLCLLCVILVDWYVGCLPIHAESL